MRKKNPAVHERRSGRNRRLQYTPFFFSRWRRRGSTGRRRVEKPAYVDIYGLRIWGLALSILFLSFADGILTGLQIIKGMSEEANPLMRAAIAQGGIYGFFGIKAALTALPLAILVLHKEWTLARHAARTCLWAYVLLALYHLYLILGVGRS